MCCRSTVAVPVAASAVAVGRLLGQLRDDGGCRSRTETAGVVADSLVAGAVVVVAAAGCWDARMRRRWPYDASDTTES